MLLLRTVIFKAIRLYLGPLMGILLSIIPSAQAQALPQPVRHVAIAQYVRHPALDAAYQGVLKGLQAEGFEVGKNLSLTYENANGNTALAAQIAKKFASLKPDCIVAIATPAAQALVATTRKHPIPIVFVAVTDPVGAKLIPAGATSTKWVTGVTDQQPVADQMEMMLKLVPSLKTLGVVYNPNEVNSIKTLQAVEAYSQGCFKVLPMIAASTAEVSSATRQLIGKVEAIYLPTDNTVVSAVGSVVKLCLAHRLPLFAADPELVPQGVLASLGFGYHAMGQLAGQQAALILQGASPQTIPVRNPSDLQLHLNTRTAHTLGVPLPEWALEDPRAIVF